MISFRVLGGKAHNEMLLGEDITDEEVGKAISKEGKVLV